MDSGTYLSTSRNFPADMPLSKEIMQVLPSDPLAQLELAQRIIFCAYNQKVMELETESAQLRDAMVQKQNTIKALERKSSSLEQEVRELQQKNKQASEEHHKLNSEKMALMDAVKKLNREVVRLESFKKNLLQHLQQDDEVAVTDQKLGNQDISDNLLSEVLGAANSPGTPFPTSSMGTSHSPMLGMYNHSGMSSTRSGTPHASPMRGSNLSSENSTCSSFTGRSPSRIAVDGKEFFKDARTRLSTEQFSQFFQLIKDLNSGRSTREQTLRKAKDIFGPEHADLFCTFESLMTRHINPL